VGHIERVCLQPQAESPFLLFSQFFFLDITYILQQLTGVPWVIIMSSSLQNRVFVICFAAVVHHIAIARAQCYYPGGAWASDQYPCNKYAYTTLCCPTGWTCFSNNLCVATDPSVVSSDLPLGTAIRGTCTNPQWNDTVCGDFCLSKFER
jgi:hypothetical protein